MTKPLVDFTFHDDLNLCDVRITLNGKSASFHDLRVKRVNLRDWQEPQLLYQVFIPSEKVLGQNWMLVCGNDAIFGYIHREAKPFVFTPESDDDIIDLPKRKKKKKDNGQLSLFGEDQS